MDTMSSDFKNIDKCGQKQENSILVCKTLGQSHEDNELILKNN